ncbi:choice-of-anchor E domain-containing protein [Colwellia sp. RE-S-Sl-9]
MKNFKKKLLSAVAVVALSPLAQAGVISYSDNHISSTTDWFDTLTVSQFDSSMGTLNTVDISFSAAMLSDMILDNDNVSATTARGTVSVDTIGSFLGLGALNIALSADTGFQALAADDSGDTDIPGAGGADEYAGLGLTGSDMMNITIDASNADFLNFIGAGTVSTVGLGTFGGYAVAGGGGNVDVNVNTSASAILNVTYNFTDKVTTSVPETGSLAIFGLGLAGFALSRKAKKSA